MEESYRKKLTRLRGYLEVGRPVWWRRGAFYRPAFPAVEPKWHVFGSRTRSTDTSTRWDYTWHALCGYQYEQSEPLSGVHDFKVTAPVLNARCKVCTGDLAAINAS